MTVRCEIAKTRRETGAWSRGEGNILVQYIDRLSGETARCNSVSAIAVEALMNNAGQTPLIDTSPTEI